MKRPIIFHKTGLDWSTNRRILLFLQHCAEAQRSAICTSFNHKTLLQVSIWKWSLFSGWHSGVCDEILKIKGLKNSWDSLKITYYYYINTYKTMRPIIYNVNVNFTSFKTLNEDVFQNINGASPFILRSLQQHRCYHN